MAGRRSVPKGGTPRTIWTFESIGHKRTGLYEKLGGKGILEGTLGCDTSLRYQTWRCRVPGPGSIVGKLGTMRCWRTIAFTLIHWGLQPPCFPMSHSGSSSLNGGCYPRAGVDPAFPRSPYSRQSGTRRPSPISPSRQGQASVPNREMPKSGPDPDRLSSDSSTVRLTTEQKRGLIMGCTGS
jgi:hypothetical protein